MTNVLAEMTRIDVNNNQIPDACEEQASDLVINENPITGQTHIACLTITSAGRVENNTTVIFKAGTSITLLPNFQVEAGATFTAMIESCVATLITPDRATSTARNENSSLENPVISQKSTLNKALELPKLKVYPNPMQDQTTLEITLSEATDIYLYLYDLNGRKISILVNGESLSKGLHHYQWQCEQVEVGMYLLVMNGRNVGKLIIVR